MANFNVKRLLLGGLAAGLVMFMVAGVVNAFFLNDQFLSWSHAMGGLLQPLAPPMQMTLWLLMCLIYGFSGVAIYAGVRPRWGAGPKTALLVALILWMLSKFSTGLDLIALGIFPGRFIAGQLAGSFVEIFLGVFLGAWIYKE